MNCLFQKTKTLEEKDFVVHVPHSTVQLRCHSWKVSIFNEWSIHSKLYLNPISCGFLVWLNLLNYHFYLKHYHGSQTVENRSLHFETYCLNVKYSYPAYPKFWPWINAYTVKLAYFCSNPWKNVN